VSFTEKDVRVARIRRAVIPAAGRGTRVRGLAGILPKEMLPVRGKPMIQRAVEMHVASGISQITVILSPRKEIIRRFLMGADTGLPEDSGADPEFLHLLQGVDLHFRMQHAPLGVAHAVSLANDFVGDEPFALIMPDCYLHSETPFLRQLIRMYEAHPVDMIGFFWLERQRAHEFGNVGLLDVTPLDPPLFKVRALSDKAPGVPRFSGRRQPKGFGGGIYSPRYFDLIASKPSKPGGEIDDVPIHQNLIRKGSLFAVELEGTPFDLGNAAGYKAALKL